MGVCCSKSDPGAVITMDRKQARGRGSFASEKTSEEKKKNALKEKKRKKAASSKAARRRMAASMSLKKKSTFIHMPLAEDRKVYKALVGFCNTSTRLCLAKAGAKSERWVVEAICEDSRVPLATLGVAVRSELPATHCVASEVSSIVAAASGQFVALVSLRCALLFAKRGDRWLVAVHCDDRHVQAIGWNQATAECFQRPIASTPPTVAVSMQWQTVVKGVVWRMANSGDTIAVGMGFGRIALLNARTGVIMTSLKGKHVAFLDKERIVGVTEDGSGKWVLCEFTSNVLTNEVLMQATDIRSMKASANGKQLYVGDSGNRQMLEHSTANWEVTARIALSGEALGQCDIAANGLLAQGIFRGEDCYAFSHCIELIETNTRCVTQTICTKHTDWISQVAFSPDSTRVVSVAKDKSVQLFDAVTGQMIGEPRVAHQKWVTSVCWLTNELFVSVSLDQSLVVWHCASQQHIARIEDAHQSRVRFVQRLSNDSFVTGAFDGSVKQWALECE